MISDSSQMVFEFRQTRQARTISGQSHALQLSACASSPLSIALIQQLSSEEYTYDTLEHYYYDVGPAI